GLVFVGRRPEFAALTAREEIPVSFSFDRRSGVRRLPIDRRPPASPVAECEWQRRLGNDFVQHGNDARAAAAFKRAIATRDCLEPAALAEARQPLGDAALRLHDPATAADAYAGIDLPAAHTNRALALLALGRPRDALAEARAARAQAPDDPDAKLAEKMA